MQFAKRQLHMLIISVPSDDGSVTRQSETL